MMQFIILRFPVDSRWTGGVVRVHLFVLYCGPWRWWFTFAGRYRYLLIIRWLYTVHSVMIPGVLLRYGWSYGYFIVLVPLFLFGLFVLYTFIVVLVPLYDLIAVSTILLELIVPDTCIYRSLCHYDCTFGIVVPYILLPWITYLWLQFDLLFIITVTIVMIYDYFTTFYVVYHVHIVWTISWQIPLKPFYHTMSVPHWYSWHCGICSITLTATVPLLMPIWTFPRWPFDGIYYRIYIPPLTATAWAVAADLVIWWFHCGITVFITVTLFIVYASFDSWWRLFIDR